MAPLARSEMNALKLGRCPGRRQATRYWSWRGYRAWLTRYTYQLCPYFSSHLPCCALIIFLRTYPSALSRFTIITYPAVPSFSTHLPCCALNFLRTYPAVHLFSVTLLNTYPIFGALFSRRTFFRRTYHAMPLFFWRLG